MSSSRIYISTYNATTYLETLFLNFPTIIFWQEKYWELRESAKPLFDLLKQVGIFHDTPDAAAAQLVNVWSDLPGWWNSDDVQTARLSFCKQFAFKPENMLRRMEHLLRDISNASKPL